jgi:hypothetical protein
MTSLKTFMQDPTILGEHNLSKREVSLGWLESLQLLFTKDMQATQYYECYVKNIQRADIVLLTSVLMYQAYLFSLYKQSYEYKVVSPAVFIIYDNFQSPKEPESFAAEAWYDLITTAFASPYFSQLGVTTGGNKVFFPKDESFYFLRAKSTEETIGLNVAGGILFLDDVLDTRGRLDRCEFPELHLGLLRRIQSRFMSPRKRYPGTLLIGVPPNFDYKYHEEYYERRIKDLELSDIEPYTSRVIEETSALASYPTETQENAS